MRNYHLYKGGTIASMCLTGRRFLYLGFLIGFAHILRDTEKKLAVLDGKETQRAWVSVDPVRAEPASFAIP